MEYSKDHNTICLDTVEHGIGKTSHRYPANISVLNGEALWMCRSQAEYGVDLSDKLRTKAWSLRVVS
jgi:hypothetical protein